MPSTTKITTTKEFLQTEFLPSLETSVDGLITITLRIIETINSSTNNDSLYNQIQEDLDAISGNDNGIKKLEEITTHYLITGGENTIELQRINKFKDKLFNLKILVASANLLLKTKRFSRGATPR